MTAPDCNAASLSFSCSPQHRLGARGERPIAAGIGCPLVPLQSDVRRREASNAKAAYWRGLELTDSAMNCRTIDHEIVR